MKRKNKQNITCTLCNCEFLASSKKRHENTYEHKREVAYKEMEDRILNENKRLKTASPEIRIHGSDSVVIPRPKRNPNTQSIC